MKKELIALALAALTGGAIPAVDLPQTVAPAPAVTVEAVQEPTARRMPMQVELNWKATPLTGYAVDGYTYYKLRDVAALLREQDCRFNVGWSQEENAVVLTRGTAYAHAAEGADAVESAPVVKSTCRLLIDGEEAAPEGILIAGHNYYKLRDLGDLLGFGVSYSSATGRIVLDAGDPFPGLPETEDWMVRLVNRSNPLPDGFVPTVCSVTGGQQFDVRAADAFNRMVADCRAAGLHPVVRSGYRTHEQQQYLLDNKLRRLRNEGYTGDLYAKAIRSVAVPGTSEHELGLAADLTSSSYTGLTAWQEETAECRWFTAHCVEYGFIVRYPNGTTDITGIIYEPWHFRYVGERAAREITLRGITLEEYTAERQSAAAAQ